MSKIYHGARFGRLTVISIHTNASRLRETRWLCGCDCGKQKVISYQCLREGKSKSCGCLRSEVTSRRTRTHGMRNSPEFSIWTNMRRRCSDPTNKHYADYGGRGIHVCRRWNTSFKHFLSDMGCRPTRHHTIDRLDNNRDYDPLNCKWSTQIEQANNRRGNVLLDYLGAKFTVRQLMPLCTNGISFNTLRSRILERGWSVEGAISVPLHQRI